MEPASRLAGDALSVGQGGALILAAWLSGLTERTGLGIAALIPAAAIPLCVMLLPRSPHRRQPAAATGSPPAAQRATPAPEAATGGIPGRPGPAGQNALRRTAGAHRLGNACSPACPCSSSRAGSASGAAHAPSWRVASAPG
jgi:hypothetical protein